MSDITGVTGMKILRAIVAGIHDPKVLAEHRDVRCKESIETIREALAGNCPEHVFTLRHALELYDFIQAKVSECDVETEAILHDLSSDRTPPETPIPPVRHAGGKRAKFDVRSALYTLLRADLARFMAWAPTPCCDSLPSAATTCGNGRHRSTSRRG